MRIFQGSLVSFCGRSHFLPRALHYLSPFPLFTTEVFASKADFPVFCHFTQFPNSAKKWKKNKLRCRKKDRNEATMRCNWRDFPLYFHHSPPDLNSFLNPSMFHLKPQIQFHNILISYNQNITLHLTWDRDGSRYFQNNSFNKSEC